MIPIEWFRVIHTEGDFPEGVTPEFLADLYDLLMKFGGEDSDKPLRRLSVTTPREIHCCVVTEERINVLVSSIPGGLRGTGAAAIILSDPLNSYIAWDTAVSLDEVKRLIADVDEEMRHVVGAFDPVTGERNRCPRAFTVSTKLRVDDLFDERGKMHVVPELATPQEALESFDKPEALTILERDDGVAVICRVEDAAYILKRSEIVYQLLKLHHGIDDGDILQLGAREQVMLIDKAMRLLKKMGL